MNRNYMWFRMWFTAVPCGYGIESYGSEKMAISWPLERLLYFLSKYSANLCVRRPLQIKCKGLRSVIGVAGQEAYTFRTTNVIS